MKEVKNLNLGESAFKLAQLLIENDARRRELHDEPDDTIVKLSSGAGRTIEATLVTDHHFLPDGPDVLNEEVNAVRRYRNDIASYIVGRSLLPNTIQFSQQRLVNVFTKVRNQISDYLNERRRKLEPTPYILFNYTQISPNTYGQYLVVETRDDNGKPRYLAMRLYVYSF